LRGLIYLASVSAAFNKQILVPPRSLPDATPCPAIPPKRKPHFFALWKDADPDIPILKDAKAEYPKLQQLPVAGKSCLYCLPVVVVIRRLHSRSRSMSVIAIFRQLCGGNPSNQIVSFALTSISLALQSRARTSKMCLVFSSRATWNAVFSADAEP
jgi:hypothetical protein